MARSAGPEAILIASVNEPALRSLQGRTLAAIATSAAADRCETLFDILIATRRSRRARYSA